MPIYHIVLPEIWEKFREKKFYETDSLKAEGFIHCSFADQVGTVLRRYYKDAERILILHIEPNLLTSKLVEEPSTGGEIYPHIYGKINIEAIVETEEKKLKLLMDTDNHT
jgi:uncharacterized protein (DUF952 family)